LKPRIAIVSGVTEIGKTTVCSRIVALGRARNLAVTGILSLPRMVAGSKIGIDIENLSSGLRRPLAEAITGIRADNERVPGEIATGGWRFHEDALDWGSDLLCSATPCDILIVDEIGPLELVNGEGWTIALDVLRASRYRLAVAVVRPALLPRFSALLRGKDLQTFIVGTANRDDLPRRILNLLQ
jgi:nucleoside-triphosphatase